MVRFHPDFFLNETGGRILFYKLFFLFNPFVYSIKYEKQKFETEVLIDTKLSADIGNNNNEQNSIYIQNLKNK